MTKGSYVLLLRLNKRTCLTIGKLGAFEFPRGYYLYFGSAQSGLESRVQRHLREDKKRHWHIDFLTAVAPVIEVSSVVGTERSECIWARSALELADATVPAPGFGSSDCSCRTHLVHLPVSRGDVTAARLKILEPDDAAAGPRSGSL
jgi:sugar fermentation stimulation protein A